ncbi:23S rRNA (uracil(1939)-C(5))-methyltransferase RlmD [Clostridium formicaceticum]|uniref:23S rRNA (Uracil-5-)-methyltransferase RumA n=1 Tax=Clostridium formicaceticum TaxID=1497 RepID=A0AAC9RPA8_9CLOT|nr:23S rRNA (uracil(1939)-C(5))-methyltransferase RlmD [Clostridium formicaceticum]AOY74750.1 23S rRNA (uracil-5-)-methyltransferase RumA [Clostridium formicaceticum]ARE89137.1 23S rRNA (uracil-C(5))-methyltransferase RlmCD [Clostridium formicaceticum]
MLQKNSIYSIEIEDMGHTGEGVGRIEGFTVFVEGGIPGDYLKIKLKTLKKNYGIGRIIQMLKPSEDRISPPCSLANTCGGCQIMHMDYGAQLAIKGKRVKEILERIGKIETTIHPTIGMENPYEYRNKAQFPVGILKGKAILGFYKKSSHDIVATDYCHIQAPINKEVIEVIKNYIETYKISVYDEKSKKGLIRHVVTKVGFATGEVMVVMITNGKELPLKNRLVEMLQKKVKGLKSVVQNINDKNTNVIFGKETLTIYGEDKIVDYIGDLKFHISAQSFFQVNPMQTKVLYEKALDYAGLTGEENVFDIYCGIGTISLFLAKKAKKVIGVEVVEAAIKDAKENARINDINNTEFYVGEAEVVIPELYEKGLKADVVVVDPPRKGCEEKVLETIVKMNPKRVVYVSCNPASLARDLAYLEGKGYKTVEVQPVDMFPHTAHVECVVGICRENT